MKKASLVMKISFMATLSLVSSCKDDLGAPAISDINNIVINGEKYRAFEYVKKFCQIPKANEDPNCILASNKAHSDASQRTSIKW